MTYNIDPRPEAHKESLALLESTHDKVTKHFRRSYLDAQRELQLKGRAAACRALDTTVRRFTDREDWRYLRAKETRQKVCSEGLR